MMMTQRNAAWYIKACTKRHNWSELNWDWKFSSFPINRALKEKMLGEWKQWKKIVDRLIQNNIYTHLKKAAEDGYMSVLVNIKKRLS